MLETHLLLHGTYPIITSLWPGLWQVHTDQLLRIELLRVELLRIELPKVELLKVESLRLDYTEDRMH